MLKRLIKRKIINNRFINPFLYAMRLDGVLNDFSQDYIDFQPNLNQSLQEIAGYSNRPEINQVLERIHQQLKVYILEDIKLKGINPYQILDIGCGPGLFLKDFETKAHLFGIDVSSSMTSIAKTQLPNADIYTGHFLKYIFQKKFDAIYSVGVLIYFSKSQIKSFFEKLADLLNDKGLVFISYPHAYRAIDLNYPDITYVHYSPQFLDMLVKAKFEIVYHAHVDGTRKVQAYDELAIPNPKGFEGRTYQNSSILVLRKK
jgi:2-polyprenyl-3-methyl-5-hydroxy-6-metoxy-1,4-benzoquinol methylase